MNLDPRQTRRLHLAGAVAFPTPFTTVGDLWGESGDLDHGDKYGTVDTVLQVFIREPREPNADTTRVVLASDVAAIFLPWDDVARVVDFEKGDWYLRSLQKPEENPDRLKRFFSDREKGCRGIVFVPEDCPVLTRHDVTETAGAACSAGRQPCCEPDARCEP